MAGLNKVMIIGRLGQNPDMKYTPGGRAVCNLSIATSEEWKDQAGQKQSRTEWHRVVAFGKQAEILEKYLSKGDQMYLEGRLQTDSWEKNGQKHYTTQIMLSEFRFLGGNGKSQGNQGNGGYQPQGNYQQQPPRQDDIPF